MRFTLKHTLAVLIFCACVTPSWAQGVFEAELVEQKADAIKEVAAAAKVARSNQVTRAQRQNTISGAVNGPTIFYLNSLLSLAGGIVQVHSQAEVDQLVAAAEREAMSTVQSSRVDKQIGSDPKSSGSTSLTQKGGLPTLLGLAVENGSVQQEVNGTTLTFTGNLGGVFDALQRRPLLLTKDDPLRSLGFSVSFDTSRGSTPSVFTGQSQQLSSFSFKYVIVNQRDVSRPRYAAKWRSLVPSAQTIATSMVQVAQTLSQDANYQSWLSSTVSKLDTAASDDDLETIVKAQFDVLEKGILGWYRANAALSAPVQKFREALDQNLGDRSKILEAAAKGFVASAQYTNFRHVNESDQSNFQFVSEGQLRDGKIDMTANASLTLNHNVGAGQGHLRDFQFAGQFDFPLATLPSLGNFVLSASGRYERLVEPTDITINGTKITGLKGDIAYAQGKLTIPVAKGVKVPLSVTIANRTELVKERDVRANVGLTFDLDSIYSLLKP